MALAATLGPLVRGVVEGLVGGATLIAEAPSADLAEIADAAGCRMIVEAEWPDGFARAVSVSGGAPLLVLAAGSVLAEGFWPMLADRLPMLGDRVAVTRQAPGRGLAGGIGALVRGLSPRIGPDRALLLPGSRARQIAQARLDPWAAISWREVVELEIEARRLPFVQ